MALVARVAGQTSSLDGSSGEVAPQIYDYSAGEDIETGMPVYLKTSDLKLYRADGTANDEKASILGFSGRTVKAGMKLTVFGPGAIFGGYTGMTPKALFYVGATPGRLDDAPTTGGTRAVARAITPTEVQVIGWY